MKFTSVTLLLLLTATSPLRGQTSRAGEELSAIQDNSFLVEEAYNQDPGVVQHILLFTRERSGGPWELSFTQEWPAPSLRHQLSYSIPLSDSELGDVQLNYRYQLLGDSGSDLAVAPRLSLILPTGEGSHRGGVQVTVPVSRIYGRRVAGHTNVGTSWSRDEGSVSLELGQSFVYALNRRVHLLVESAYSWTSDESELLVSPGVRWAYDFRNGLQIVPGVALPFGAGPSHGTRALLLYLSFEHPFRRTSGRQGTSEVP